MNIQIRPAQPDDAGAILRLIEALAAFEKLPPPDDAARERLIADAFGPHPALRDLPRRRRCPGRGLRLCLRDLFNFPGSPLFISRRPLRPARIPLSSRRLRAFQPLR